MKQRWDESKWRQAGLLFLAAVVIAGCGDSSNGGSGGSSSTTPTFERMQTQVFNLSCSSDSCHSHVGQAGGLILEAGYAWDSLVNHRASNGVAAAHGLMRVMPGNPDASFLMNKISANLEAGEGAPMPYNSSPLTSDTVDIIHAWIAAGAPQDGVVQGDDGRPMGDTGENNGPFSLAPPEHGVQIKTTSPPIPVGKEETGCHYLKLPSDVDFDSNRIQVAVTGGSHHIHLYRAYDRSLDLADGYEVCNHAVDFNTWELVVADQVRQLDWELPSGVGYHFRAGEQLLIQTHFVNVGALQTMGEGVAAINLQAANPGEVTQHAGSMFGQDKDVDVLPHSSPTEDAECVFPKALSLMGETGHYHFRGREFNTYLWNNGVQGDKIYQYDGYDDPPFKIHDPAINFAPGGGIQWECHWVNDSDTEYKFGPFTDTNEHCNWFAFYYPTESLDESVTCVKSNGVSTTMVRTSSSGSPPPAMNTPVPTPVPGQFSGRYTGTVALDAGRSGAVSLTVHNGQATGKLTISGGTKQETVSLVGLVDELGGTFSTHGTSSDGTVVAVVSGTLPSLSAVPGYLAVQIGTTLTPFRGTISAG